MWCHCATGVYCPSIFFTKKAQELSSALMLEMKLKRTSAREFFGYYDSICSPVMILPCIMLVNASTINDWNRHVVFGPSLHMGYASASSQ